MIALDAKMSIDSNAFFRHKALFAEEDEGEKDPYEAEAEKYHLNFIKLDGNIGCMVNGAGLAMATMDIIQYEAEKRGVVASPQTSWMLVAQRSTSKLKLP